MQREGAERPGSAPIARISQAAAIWPPDLADLIHSLNNFFAFS